MIPTIIKNIAADREIYPSIPKHLVTLEVVAAASVLAQSLALGTEPNRRHYLEVIPRYIASLPSDPLEAATVCKRDASAVLKIDLASDHDELVLAIRDSEAAAAKVAELEAVQSRKLARIESLENLITAAENRLGAWNLDFDAEEKQAEKSILENYGRQAVNAPFDILQKIAVLRKLAPIAIAEIESEIAAHNAELVTLQSLPKVKRAA